MRRIKARFSSDHPIFSSIPIPSLTRIRNIHLPSPSELTPSYLREKIIEEVRKRIIFADPPRVTTSDQPRQTSNPGYSPAPSNPPVQYQYSPNPGYSPVSYYPPPVPYYPPVSLAPINPIYIHERIMEVSNCIVYRRDQEGADILKPLLDQLNLNHSQVPRDLYGMVCYLYSYCLLRLGSYEDAIDNVKNAKISLPDHNYRNVRFHLDLICGASFFGLYKRQNQVENLNESKRFRNFCMQNQESMKECDFIAHEVHFLHSLILAEEGLFESAKKSVEIAICTISNNEKFIKHIKEICMLEYLKHLKEICMHKGELIEAIKALVMIDDILCSNGFMSYEIKQLLGFCYLLHNDYDKAEITFNLLFMINDRNVCLNANKSLALVGILRLQEKIKASNNSRTQEQLDLAVRINSHYEDLSRGMPTQDINIQLGLLILNCFIYGSNRYTSKYVSLKTQARFKTLSNNPIPDDISFYILAKIASCNFTDSFFDYSQQTFEAELQHLNLFKGSLLLIELSRVGASAGTSYTAPHHNNNFQSALAMSPPGNEFQGYISSTQGQAQLLPPPSHGPLLNQNTLFADRNSRNSSSSQSAGEQSSPFYFEFN